MNLEELRALGLDLIKEEGRLLIKVANGEASPEEVDQYQTLRGMIDEIDARLYRAFGDGGGLTPTRS